MKKPYITVCICTYKRQDMIARLLKKLEEQETGNILDYAIVVVDNDKSESARLTVESLANNSKIQVKYCIEPEQSISLARNRAISNAHGDYVALIDDDEFPAKNWLITLFNAIKQYNADGVLAPVLPYFETEPPKWVLKGHFFDRRTHGTGHILEPENTRTGNALLKREIFKDGVVWFDPKFGSGGEDRDFFKRQIGEGRIFVWCNDAPAYETVPPERWDRKVLIKRALLRGKMAANAAKSKPLSILISLAAISIYTLGLPFFLVSGQHIFMKYLIKDCDHIGKVLSFFGIDIIKEKYIHG